jgi:CopG family nickel-responsive transcriptional regulator
MQRITITIDDELVTALDRIIAAHGYQNRSEAIRDLARAGIAQLQEDRDHPQSTVAALVYVYDHQERALAPDEVLSPASRSVGCHNAHPP